MYEKISKAQQKAVQKYVAKNYDRIVLTLPKGERDLVKSAAQSAGVSTNGYIVEALHNRMKEEGQIS